MSMINLMVLRHMLRDRRGAVALVTAILAPAMLVGVAFTVETSLIKVRQSQLQTVADAAAGGARESLDPFTPTDLAQGGQKDPITEATRLALLSDLPNSVSSTDVHEGWWDITKTDGPEGADKFGPPVPGQTGAPFSNAVRVIAHQNYHYIMGGLIGQSDVILTAESTGYKCSNLDYPLTRINDDPFPPDKPAIYLSWATPDHPDANTSYHYDNPTGGYRNPVIKFWSPTDGEDVSFVLKDPNGNNLLQVDTYCRGTFLVIPANFDWRNLAGPLTVSIYRGSTNNSFDLYPPNPKKYPLAFLTTTYYVDPTQNFAIPQTFLDPTKVKTTPYPSSQGIGYWASQGDPTPIRQSLLVR